MTPWSPRQALGCQRSTLTGRATSPPQPGDPTRPRCRMSDSSLQGVQPCGSAGPSVPGCQASSLPGWLSSIWCAHGGASIVFLELWKPWVWRGGSQGACLMGVLCAAHAWHLSIALWVSVLVPGAFFQGVLQGLLAACLPCCQVQAASVALLLQIHSAERRPAAGTACPAWWRTATMRTAWCCMAT